MSALPERLSATSKAPAILPGTLFVVPSALVLKLIRIPPGCLLALYEIRTGSLLVAGRSPTIQRMARSQQSYPLIGCFVRSRTELRRELSIPETPIEAVRRRHLFGQIGQQLRSTEEIFRAARAELGPSLESELRRTVINELRATGRPPGRKATRQQDRRQIALLRQISKRCTPAPAPLKSLAPHGRDPTVWTKSANTQLRRFCLRVYQLWRDLGFPDLRVPWFRAQLTSECSFELPGDECAALEALERGGEYSHARGRQNPVGDLS